MEHLSSVSPWNAVSVIVLLIVALSILQGARRGATGSARQLYGFVSEGAAAAAALYLAWKGMGLLSPVLRAWLIGRDIAIPNRELSMWAQMYYTFVTSLRDFSLMRSTLVFLVLYGFVKGLLAHFVLPVLDRAVASSGRSREGTGTARRASAWTSVPAGALIGGITGAGRALIFIAGVLVYTTLFPDSPVAAYASQSSLYQRGAKDVIGPLTGRMLDKLPVLAGSVEDEFNQILKRKYEVLDARIPEDIAAAAQEITARKTTDEEKAKALYQWVGTRVKYDWEKVRLYEEERVWKEQTPEDTYKTRTGVCIDYSRLYAVMARAVGLEVKVVTGLGSDGRGGLGSHAWNEVYLAESGSWVPLDSTWVSSGGNWFNPADFNDTHIKES
ncbi:transglutaminase domain-containing protein [Gorillibacterium sp. sgz5001074]|uniref:transglutaminase domain-containing protein n=1 Tax=Gorillibacterium sp. sgz5001074 TaxID=3446695 RepID=UPI003F667572